MNLSQCQNLIKRKEFGAALKYLLKFEKNNTSDIQVLFYLNFTRRFASAMPINECSEIAK